MVSQLEVSALPLAPDAIVRGLVQVFVTPDRTFLTDVMAQALRVAGQGQSVLVMQFLKGGIRQGGNRPISLVQRHLRIGYNRAARLLEQMEKSGLVSAMASNGNRELLVPSSQDA